MVEKSSFSESRISWYFACCEANPNAHAVKITASIAHIVLYRMKFEASSWDLWSQNCGSRTGIGQKCTFFIRGCTCGVSVSVKKHFEIEIFGISRFFWMLYRSSILRKESEIRQVPGMVGALVDPLLREGPWENHAFEDSWHLMNFRSCFWLHHRKERNELMRKSYFTSFAMLSSRWYRSESKNLTKNGHFRLFLKFMSAFFYFKSRKVDWYLISKRDHEWTLAIRLSIVRCNLTPPGPKYQKRRSSKIRFFHGFSKFLIS